jgi:hypothetical protein
VAETRTIVEVPAGYLEPTFGDRFVVTFGDRPRAEA